MRVFITITLEVIEITDVACLLETVASSSSILNILGHVETVHKGKGI